MSQTAAHSFHPRNLIQFILLILCVFYLYFLTRNTDGSPLIYQGVAMGLVMILVVQMVVFARKEIHHLGHDPIYALVFPFLFGFSWNHVFYPMLFVFVRDYQFSIRVYFDYGHLHEDIAQLTVLAGIMALVGFTGFMLGYDATPVGKTRTKSANWKLQHSLWLDGALMVSLLGVYGYIFSYGGLKSFLLNIMLIRGGVMEPSTVLGGYGIYAISLTQSFSILYLIATIRNKSGTWRRLLNFGLQMLCIFLLFLTGGRMVIIMHLVIIMLLLRMFRRVPVPLVILSALVCMGIIVFMHDILFLIQGNVYSEVGNGSRLDNLLLVTDGLIAANFNYDELILILGDFRDNIPWWPLKPLLDTMFAFWPDRIINLGFSGEGKFTYQLTELISNRPAEKTMTPSFLGLWYLMGRWPGVFLGPMLTGSALKRSLGWLPRLKDNDFLLVAYLFLYLVIFSLAMTGSIEAVFKGYTIRILPLFVLRPLLFSRRPV